MDDSYIVPVLCLVWLLCSFHVNLVTAQSVHNCINNSQKWAAREPHLVTKDRVLDPRMTCCDYAHMFSSRHQKKNTGGYFRERHGVGMISQYLWWGNTKISRLGRVIGKEDTLRALNTSLVLHPIKGLRGCILEQDAMWHPGLEQLLWSHQILSLSVISSNSDFRATQNGTAIVSTDKLVESIRDSGAPMFDFCALVHYASQSGLNRFDEGYHPFADFEILDYMRCLLVPGGRIYFGVRHSASDCISLTIPLRIHGDERIRSIARETELMIEEGEIESELKNCSVETPPSMVVLLKPQLHNSAYFEGNLKQNLTSHGQQPLFDVCNMKVLVSKIGGGRFGNYLVQSAPFFGLLNVFNLFLIENAYWQTALEKSANYSMNSDYSDFDVPFVSWASCFPRVGNYFLEKQLKRSVDLYKRLTDNRSCDVGKIIGLGRDSNWSLQKLARSFYESTNSEFINERKIGELLQAKDNAEILKSLPRLLKTDPWGTGGSMWWNFDLLVRPHFRKLRDFYFRPQCCNDTSGNGSAIIVHFRDFRNEAGTTASLKWLLQRPTLRLSYIAQLASKYAGSSSDRTVTVVTEQSVLENKENTVPIVTAFPRISFQSNTPTRDFCTLYQAKDTIIVSPESSFSYWGGLLSSADRIVVPSVKGVGGLNEDDSPRALRNVWPLQNNSLPFARIEFETVPHWAIDTRMHDGSELHWIDRTFDNGTMRPIPLKRGGYLWKPK